MHPPRKATHRGHAGNPAPQVARRSAQTAPRRDADTAFGGWLADIGANLLCVVLVLLVLLALAPSLPGMAPAPPAPLPVIRTAPVSGAEGVRLLSHLAAPPPDQLVLALGPEGIRLRITVDEAAPIAPEDLPAGAPAATLHVFAPDHYAATLTALRARGIPFAEITVPEALRAKVNEGGALWSPAYLSALEGVRSLTGYRAALRSHLDRVAKGGPAEGDAQRTAQGAAIGSGSSLSDRLEALRRNINLILLGLGLLVCLVVFRIGRVTTADVAAPAAQSRLRARPSAPPPPPR